LFARSGSGIVTRPTRGEVRMSLFHAQDPVSDGWTYPSEEPPLSPPISGVRVRVEGGWLTRLVGAGSRFRSALRSARPDPEPRALLEAAEVLERDGGVVFADLDGWPRPPVVSGFVPDLYAVFEDREIVLSFVNDESVLREQSRRRDLAFSAWAGASALRIYEQIVVEGGRGGRG
jgi:hypothetical protein